MSDLRPHLRRHFRALVVISVTLVSAAVLSILVGGRLFGAAPAQATDGSTPVPAAAAASLNSWYGMTVTDADAAINPPVSANTALDAAKAGTDFLDGQSPSASLVYFTDPTYGTLTSDADGASVIPFSDHRLTWLILFRHASEVPMGSEPGAGLVTQAVAVAAFIDANTGEYIKASTLNDLP